MGIGANELVIDDGNYKQLLAPQLVGGVEMGRGYYARDFNKVPHGSMAYAAKLPFPLIPRSEWSARIKEKEERKARLSDIRRQAGLRSSNQRSTNYCWAHSVVNAVRILRAKEGQEFVELSAASVAAPIKNFRNQGGWSHQALEWIATNGVAPASIWPENAISRRYYTPEAKQAALLYRVTEWYDVTPRSFDEKMTLLLLDIPVSCGYDWWGHAIMALDPVEIERNSFGSREWNSWGDEYGTDGMLILAEPKSRPDDAVAPASSTAAPASTAVAA